MAYLYPHPTKPGRFVSRQRLYQLRREADGLCGRDGRRKLWKQGLCRTCYAKWAEARAKRLGAK